ncbi:DUF2786 domain-containing protein [Acinetobacter seifertii]|uniref:DUF2786 domain-containing protein n=1 Tax=Acinetobacter seifertii TaxID=1530123 RepID=UPI00168BFBE7|nr:DUF2786 domain-containing protein [Acinetobacter seifertii]MBD1229816.1 DUF2786 domain-containing protein [Acinetobacter seifertii]QNX11370.1 DUF2786 domain-containing protein [Acinetobacter seifertii]QNX18935.1 DUF2786 domain-containing protein [Acinetobacter seifertii]QNX25541.1 DUF2786 domain-containing protein [Acinetobacter seifertii]QNX36568.1 DUF2786 domain-containing protein [Acinetobacter seifertii]
MSMNREEAILKIKKCLALAKSANENEAAIALRQAQALMREFQIDPDLLDIVEASCESKATKVPQAWESSLVMTIARAMQCKPIFSSGSSTWGIKASWTFIGVDPAPEVASYTFDVLYRQVIRSRKSFIENSLKRVSVKKNKVRRADLFCEGWVDSVKHLITDLDIDVPTNTTERIKKYMDKTRGKLGSFTPKDRNKGKAFNDRAANDYHAGKQSGKSAKLNQAMNGGKQYEKLGAPT